MYMNEIRIDLLNIILLTKLLTFSPSPFCSVFPLVPHRYIPSLCWRLPDSMVAGFVRGVLVRKGPNHVLVLGRGMSECG